MFTITGKTNKQEFKETRETAKLALRCGISMYKELGGMITVSYFKNAKEVSYIDMIKISENEK